MGALDLTKAYPVRIAAETNKSSPPGIELLRRGQGDRQERIGCSENFKTGILLPNKPQHAQIVRLGG